MILIVHNNLENPYKLKKDSAKLLLNGFLLIIFPLVIFAVLIFVFVEENGYNKEDFLNKWMFLTSIPATIYVILICMGINKIKKGIDIRNHLKNTSTNSPENKYKEIDLHNKSSLILKKYSAKWVIVGVFLLALAMIYVLVLTIIFAGEEGNIRLDAPREYIFLALIPLVIGNILIIMDVKRSEKENLKISNLLKNTPNVSPKDLSRKIEMHNNPKNSKEPLIVGLIIQISSIFLILIMLGVFGWFK